MNKFKLGVLAISMLASNAFALNNTSANFQAGATLNASCIISVENMNLGLYKPRPENNDTDLWSGEIFTTCSNGVNVDISLSAGNSNDITQRKMIGSAGNNDVLNYNIYKEFNSNRIILSDGSILANASTIKYTSDGSEKASSFVIAVPVNQYIKPDTYTDNLTFTITY